MITEIEHFWRTANVSLVSILFVLNRYYGLIGTLPLIFEYLVNISEHVSDSTFSLVSYHIDGVF